MTKAIAYSDFLKNKIFVHLVKTVLLRQRSPLPSGPETFKMNTD